VAKLREALGHIRKRLHIAGSISLMKAQKEQYCGIIDANDSLS
jgi:hypothetical protein